MSHQKAPVTELRERSLFCRNHSDRWLVGRRVGNRWHGTQPADPRTLICVQLSGVTTIVHEPHLAESRVRITLVVICVNTHADIHRVWLSQQMVSYVSQWAYIQRKRWGGGFAGGYGSLGDFIGFILQHLIMGKSRPVCISSNRATNSDSGPMANAPNLWT